MLDVEVFKVPMASPDDVSQVQQLIAAGSVNPAEIVAVMTKTEGNGNVNDFTRALANLAFEVLLGEHLGMGRNAIHQRIALVHSGGCEGVLSPHATIFTRRSVARSPKGQKRLTVGVAFTRDFLPEEIGTTVQVEATAEAVARAMQEAGIDDPEDIHFAQIKCPLLTSDRVLEAGRRGRRVVTTDTLKSMQYSRGASALGVAVALREVAHTQVSDDVILHDFSLYSSVASASAGVELTNNVVVVLGNSPRSVSRYVIGHSVMEDALDASHVRAALRAAGIEVGDELAAEDRKRIKNVFAKAGAHPTGYVRGRRTTLLMDSDLPATRQIRAVVGAVIASIVGDPMIYVSGGSEHQGPPGGGPVAVIAEA